MDFIVRPKIEDNANSIKIQKKRLTNRKMSIAGLDLDFRETRIEKSRPINFTDGRRKTDRQQSPAPRKRPSLDSCQFRTSFKRQILKP
jgi:hypothetical protein